MSIKQLSIPKSPIVKINPSLDIYADQNLFPEKVAEANRTLKKYKLPKVKAKYPASEDYLLVEDKETQFHARSSKQGKKKR